MAIFEGNLSGQGLRFGVVVSRFNDFISRRLLEGALDALKRHDVNTEDLSIVWVPGAFEIPLAAKKLAIAGNYEAVICLGAVIRGNTPHFEYICSEVAKGIGQVNLETGVPVIFGVITADTIDQAVERAGAKQDNKGHLAATTGIEMANLMKRLP